jgi:Flp pilus assembly protein TadG
MSPTSDRDRGTSPIELAILLPTIILALFASIQVAMYFLARAEALAAAQYAVSVQRAYGAAKCDGHDAAQQLLSSGYAGAWLDTQKVNDPIVVTPCDKMPPNDDPNGVTATITGTAPSLVFFWTINITATVHGTNEIVTPAPSPSVSQPPPGPPLPP